MRRSSLLASSRYSAVVSRQRSILAAQVDAAAHALQRVANLVNHVRGQPRHSRQLLVVQQLALLLFLAGYIAPALDHLLRAVAGCHGIAINLVPALPPICSSAARAP